MCIYFAFYESCPKSVWVGVKYHLLQLAIIYLKLSFRDAIREQQDSAKMI